MDMNAGSIQQDLIQVQVMLSIGLEFRFFTFLFQLTRSHNSRKITTIRVGTMCFIICAIKYRT